MEPTWFMNKAPQWKDPVRILRFILSAKPPFRLDLTVWALKRRALNAVDYWDGRTYIRILVVDKTLVKVEVTQDKNRVLVVASSRRLTLKLKEKLTAILNDMLGIRLDLLGWILRRSSGWKKSGSPSPDSFIFTICFIRQK